MSPVLSHQLEKLQRATRSGATRLRASEREVCLREDLWEDLWEPLKNLWKLLKTLWKPLKTSENPPSQRPSQRLSVLLPLLICPLNSLRTKEISCRFRRFLMSSRFLRGLETSLLSRLLIVFSPQKTKESKNEVVFAYWWLDLCMLREPRFDLWRVASHIFRSTGASSGQFALSRQEDPRILRNRIP